MSLDPATIMQLIQQSRGGQMPAAQAQAYQSAQMPGQIAMGMGGVPSGANRSAGTTSALTKLALAMMQRKRMQDYQQQYGRLGQPQVPSMAQGQTLSSPAVDTSSAPAGMMGPP